MPTSPQTDTRTLYFILAALTLALAGILILLAKQSGLAPFNSLGALSGRVVYQGEPPQPAKLMVVADLAVCGKHQPYDNRLKVGTNKGIEDAVVSLTSVEAGASLEKMGGEFVLDQRGCSYRPHVLLAPINTPLQIYNNDPVYHNVHTYSSRNPAMNLAHPQTLEKLEIVFTAPEKIQLRCDIHGWMSAWIIAVDHPYYALTDAAGRFTLEGIPPGTYTVHCWQELLGEQSAQVKIERGGQTTFDFTYPAPE
jgi:hypothetical protein